MMFARADADQDGVISKDEMAKLGPRDFNGKPPITKEQYIEWLTTKLESGQRSISGRGSPKSGFRRPTTPPQARRDASDNKEKASETEPEEKEEEAGDTDKK
jgi:hypothetical protein